MAVHSEREVKPLEQHIRSFPEARHSVRRRR
jgi:hypothetical protein